MLKVSRLVLLTTLLPIPVLAAGEQSPVAVSGKEAVAEVVIPFQPPLGKLLQYSTIRSGQDGEDRLAIRFERAGGAYTMHGSRQLAEGGPAKVFERALAQPVVLTVDEDGEITGIVDEDAYWNRVAAAVKASTAPANARESARRFLAEIRAKPERLRLAIATRDYASILGGVGTHRSIKAAAGKLLPYNIEVTQTADHATIVAGAEMGRDQMAKFIDFMRASGAPFDGPARPDVSFGIRQTHVVVRRTGLLQRSESVSQGNYAGRQTRVVTTTRLLPETEG